MLDGSELAAATNRKLMLFTPAVLGRPSARACGL